MSNMLRRMDHLHLPLASSTANRAERGLHPLMARTLALAMVSGIGLHRLAKMAGYADNSLYLWRRGVMPGADKLNDVLNVLGYELRIVKKDG